MIRFKKAIRDRWESLNSYINAEWPMYCAYRTWKDDIVDPMMRLPFGILALAIILFGWSLLAILGFLFLAQWAEEAIFHE